MVVGTQAATSTEIDCCHGLTTVTGESRSLLACLCLAKPSLGSDEMMEVGEGVNGGEDGGELSGQR